MELNYEERMQDCIFLALTKQSLIQGVEDN